jgi:hypothetical protein
MGERIRSGEATAEEYFEMGSIMLRKKVFTQAVRNLKLAAQMWEGDQEVGPDPNNSTSVSQSWQAHPHTVTSRHPNRDSQTLHPNIEP